MESINALWADAHFLYIKLALKGLIKKRNYDINMN
jgi:hypothetical protein